MTTGASQLEDPIPTVLRSISYLSERIGGRGSCTAEELEAADYIAGELTASGITAVRQEPFQAIPGTYWPYACGFSAALAGSLLLLFTPGRIPLLLAACLSFLGVWAMLGETEFANHWARWLLPRRSSQNVIGVIGRDNILSLVDVRSQLGA